MDDQGKRYYNNILTLIADSAIVYRYTFLSEILNLIILKLNLRFIRIVGFQVKNLR